MSNNEIVPGFDDEKDDSLKIRLQKIDDTDGCLVLYLTGYIDTYNSNYFQKRVAKAIEGNFAKRQSYKQPARHDSIQLAYLFSLRGFAYKKLRRPEKAFADFNESLRVTDELIKAYPTLDDNKTFQGIKAYFLLRRGVAAESLGRPEAAVHDFQQACALGDGDGCRLLERPGTTSP